MLTFAPQKWIVFSNTNTKKGILITNTKQKL